MADLDSISESSHVRRAGDEQLLIVVGPRVSGLDLTPADLHRLRAVDALVPIIVCLPPQHPLQRRWGELATARVDRVVTLGAVDGDADLRRDAQEALRHVLPPEVDLAVDVSISRRGVALELFCARNGYLRLRVSSLADEFNVDRGTILKDAKKQGWQDVQSLIRVSRALHEAVLLERMSIRTTAIARSLHFGSPSALYHYTRRATGRTIGQLKFESALRIAVGLWRSRRS